MRVTKHVLHKQYYIKTNKQKGMNKLIENINHGKSIRKLNGLGEK